MIEKIIHQSRTTEVAAVATLMIGAFNKSDWSADAFLTTSFAALAQQRNRLTIAINRSKAESELEMKDELRDDRLRGLNYLLVAFINHPDPEIRAAAETIEAVFDKYGLSIVRKSYGVESALVNSLLIDLEDEALAASIAKIPGCAEIIAGLKMAQADFEETRITYEEDKGKEGMEESATTIKKAVLAIINDQVVVYLRAMSQVDPGLYGDLTRTLNEIISESNIQVKKRTKKTASVS